MFMAKKTEEKPIKSQRSQRISSKTPLEKKDLPKKKPKADPETLHTSDPQENMKGPISSFMQRTKHIVEKNDALSKEEATRKRDDRM